MVFTSVTNRIRDSSMKYAPWMVVFATLAGGSIAQAGYFGAASYKCCPTQACVPSGDYCAAQSCCGPCYRTVKEVVWDTKTYTCCRTVMDQICEQVPVTCTQIV